MRVLVFSDSHGFNSPLETAIDSHPDIEHIIFLGDGVAGVEDIRRFYNKKFYLVRGNCDFACDLPLIDTLVLNGKKIIFTHGHTLDVKYTTERLFEFAKQNNANIILFGHTHIAHSEYNDGVYIINPGSVSRSRNGKNSYAIIDILENGIMPNIIKI